MHILTARQQPKMANGNRLPTEYMEQSSHEYWNDEDDVSRWIRNALDGPDSPGIAFLTCLKFLRAAFFFTDISFSHFRCYVLFSRCRRGRGLDRTRCVDCSISDMWLPLLLPRMRVHGWRGHSAFGRPSSPAGARFRRISTQCLSTQARRSTPPSCQ